MSTPGNDADRICDNIAEIITKRRAALGLTKHDVAKRAGVSAQVVYNVEKRLATPRLDIAVRICLGLGMCWGDLGAEAANGNGETAGKTAGHK